MNLDTIKCFICSTGFESNRTFTLVSLGPERLWFCNRHILQKRALQHLSDDAALSRLLNHQAHFNRPRVFPVETRPSPPLRPPRFGGGNATPQCRAKTPLFCVAK